jgi:MFS family permease
MLLPYLPIFVEELGIKQQGSIVQWSGLALGATFLGTRFTAPLWGHLGDNTVASLCSCGQPLVWPSSCPSSVTHTMSIAAANWFCERSVYEDDAEVSALIYLHQSI